MPDEIDCTQSTGPEIADTEIDWQAYMQEVAGYDEVNTTA